MKEPSIAGFCRVLGLLAMACVGAAVSTEAAAQGVKGNVQWLPMSSGRDPGLPAGAEAHRDIAYGSDADERLDIYVPQGARQAPVIFMVHGGAWRTGDKANPKVVDNKLAYWLPKGYLFISVNYPMLPGTDPLGQAREVARALAFAQNQVEQYGGDGNRLVLMGHSAGAHLVALLDAEPSLALGLGARPWRGAVALDSAAYDVAANMNEPHLGLKDRAFGDDPDYWRRVSPSDQLQPQAPPLLLVCSSRRRQSCPQAEAFAEKANGLGISAKVLPQDKSHGEINGDLGLPGEYTAAVDRSIQGFLQ